MKLVLINHHGRMLAVDPETGRAIKGVIRLNVQQDFDGKTSAGIEFDTEFADVPAGWEPGQPLDKAGGEVDVL